MQYLEKDAGESAFLDPPPPTIRLQLTWVAFCLLALLLLLLLLLLLEGRTFSASPPPSGLLGKLCQHIDLHQEEFVTLGEAASVRCRDQGFHSGTLGGILNEPMADLVALLGSLVDSSGHILIPGIYDQVAPLTEEEKKLYEAIEMDLEEYRNASQVEKFLFDTKEEILMHLWRYPSLSIHGIEGAFDEPGTKTVIPGQVIGKFSIRLVPHMNMSVVEKQVRQHLEGMFSNRNSSDRMAASTTLGLQPWIANINDMQDLAAKRAISRVFGTEPDMMRAGSTIPIAKMIQDIIQKSVMMLPLGTVDDGEHSQNEKINRWNYIEGSKLFASFFLEIAKLHSGQ
ncbi:LOW QUALITY PROTEIN: beta-Ala-His dipeptidase-like [Callospermophilus lateralis]|uniref:LOW QUALITY PROTEIN: beta-Ala-His dipeptidase-like n=1 Tax=Callospermophilus lateralis TaxID=76772 RepID=UPI0040386411